MKQDIFFKCIHSPIGWLKLESNADSLISLSFIEKELESSMKQPEILVLATIQLQEYFEGLRVEFNLEVAPEGTTFQQQVWSWVAKIKFGETSSYLAIAKKTGSKNNTRAVGMANGKNPLPIIIPCHRIIGSNGKLTGYAGGLEIKRWLLRHEQQHSNNKTTLF